MLEISAPGKTEGNPFTDYTYTAIFRGKHEMVTVSGFYNGDGVYRARFMPSFEGGYTYEMSDSFGKTAVGGFVVTSPSEKTMAPCEW